MTQEQFYTELMKMNICLTSVQKQQLEEYYNFLIEYNANVNLTTIVAKKDVYLKHFYDSLTLARNYDFNRNLQLCDVGTGAGFPGVVLKIVFPNLKITLIDSLNKRIVFLNQLIEKLGLVKIEALHARMEEYSKANVQQFDVIVSRAVSSISVISEISCQSLKVGGKLILMRGLFEEDVATIDNYLNKLSLKCDRVDNFLLPYEGSHRAILIINKESFTQLKYPRAIDKIKKNPL